MSILDNIKTKLKEEQNDSTGQVASTLQDQAVAAILAGIDSKESSAWVTYMKNFVDEGGNPQQLARLTAQDNTKDDPAMRRALAYLVSNAVCGADTTTRLPDGLEDGLIDKGL